MTPTLFKLALCTGTALFAAGCGKNDSPPLPTIAPPTLSVQGGLSTPTLPTAPLPEPTVPKGAEAPSPTPGQAGDHSTPAFKAGGKTDPNK